MSEVGQQLILFGARRQYVLTVERFVLNVWANCEIPPSPSTVGRVGRVDMNGSATYVRVRGPFETLDNSCVKLSGNLDPLKWLSDRVQRGERCEIEVEDSTDGLTPATGEA